MLINRVKITISILIVVSCYMLHVTYVSAQQITLSFSPPLIETVIKPGKTILIAYTLKNIGDPVIIKTKVLPFTAQDYLGNIKIDSEFSGPVRFFLDNSDIELGQPFALNSKQSRQLLLRIRIPEGAPNGDYYYTFLAETQPAPHLESSSASTSKATVGANILVTVTDSGDIEIKAKIALLDVFSRFKLNLLGKTLRIFDSNDQIPVSLIVVNLGNNFIKPQGTIDLHGNFGEKAQYEIIPQNVLSQSQRLMIATPSAEVRALRLMPQQLISLIIPGFFIGRYLITADVNFGQGTSPLVSTVSFIAFPFKISLIIFACIFIIRLIVIKQKKDNPE